MRPFRPALRIRIRAAGAQDADTLLRLAKTSVIEGTTAFYCSAQRHAWARALDRPPGFAARIAGQHSFAALGTEHGDIVGFMTLGTDGHLDLAYVAPSAMRRGVGAALHDRVVAHATSLGHTRLTTEASHLARHAFRRFGWHEIAAQSVAVFDQSLQNFRMEKRLAAPDR